ncbi:MAG: MFS transporter [Thioalkalivibrio sp.]
MSSGAPTSVPHVWRTPVLIISAAGIVLCLALGIRHSMGIYLQPVSLTHGWGREIFGFAIALQNLVWGLAQPITGAIADRMGAGRVIFTGGTLYALGLATMVSTSDPVLFNLGVGVLIGLGLSCTGFSIVFGVVARNVPVQKRSLALGITGACGSFGQFAMLPIGHMLLGMGDWVFAITVLAITLAAMLPLAFILSGRPVHMTTIDSGPGFAESLRQAMSHTGFNFLIFGFLVCGLHTMFMAAHLPAYLSDAGLGAREGMMALALIGAFNVLGSYLCGWLGGHFRKKYLLAGIFALRTVAIAAFMLLPITTTSVYIFSIVMGLTWLGTVPLTSGLIADIFGPRYLGTLFGIAFLGHQIGSFLGAWLGGAVFDTTGSYTIVWALSLGLAIMATLIYLPVNDRPFGTQLRPMIPA